MGKMIFFKISISVLFHAMKQILFLHIRECTTLLNKGKEFRSEVFRGVQGWTWVERSI